MSDPKITVIGAVSYFFGRPVIYKMTTSKTMTGGTLALVDTDENVLKCNFVYLIAWWVLLPLTVVDSIGTA